MTLYSPALLSRKISIHIENVGSNLESVIRTHLAFLYEAKCSKEGFIKRDSVELVTYSSGRLSEGINILFDVVFKCEVCFPLDGMIIECVATNVTKAGIHAEVLNERDLPVVIYVARDHYYNNTSFTNVKENDLISIRVIGNRFELNDSEISVIAELVSEH